MDKKVFKLIMNERSMSGKYTLDSNKFSIDYSNSIGKTIVPKIGKLFCFVDYESLLEFLRPYAYKGDFKILYGTAFNVCNIKYVANYSSDIPIFWKQRAQKKKITIYKINTPTGTIFCDSFKVEKIYTVNLRLLEKE